MRAPVADTEKDERRARFELLPPGRYRLPIERRRRGAANERFQVAQREDPRPGIVEQRGDPLVIVAALADAIERVAGEAVNLFHDRADSSCPCYLRASDEVGPQRLRG